MKHFIPSIIAVASLLLSGAALAAPPAGGGSLATQSCPGLFGDQALQQRNAARRQHNIDWVEEDESGVTIAHTRTGWGDEPFRLSIRGLRLLGVQGGSAVFQVSGEAASAGHCRPGRYVVGVDSSLSRHTRVLAVLSRGLLVEHRGKLAYVAPPSAAAPVWLLAWRMEGEIASNGSSSPTSSPVIY